MSLKIAYCIPSLYSVSGMEKTLTIKANYFADVLNYKIIIILTDGIGREPAFPLSPKIEVINLNINYDKIWSYPFYVKVFAYTFKQILFRKRLSAALKNIKPQITVSMLRREINFITKIKDGSIKIGEIHFSKGKYRDLDSADKNFSLKGLFAGLWMRQLIVNLKRLQKFVVLSYEDKEKWVELDRKSTRLNSSH